MDSGRRDRNYAGHQRVARGLEGGRCPNQRRINGAPEFRHVIFSERDREIASLTL